MRIGIDLSPLQGPHRMRGIGFTLLNYINSLQATEKKDNHYIFFTLPDVDVMFKNPLELIDVNDLSYEIRVIKSKKRALGKLPRQLHQIVGILNSILDLRDYYLGDSRISKLKDIDIFMQFDQSQSLPKKWGMKTVLILYDIIPYVLEWDYLISFKTAKHSNHSFKGSVKLQLQRYLYMKKLRINVKHAKYLVAISEATKQDFIRYTRVKPKKIKVVPLGITLPTVGDRNPPIKILQYLRNSWGYIKRPINFDEPYLLFVGGTDSRRKLEDLIAAFNLIRARGHKIKLVLVGDIMLGPEAITNQVLRKALKSSSYLDDIVFMGFVDDAIRNWLYKNALVFVFPSVYEGFGLPVLEAMSYGTLVLSRNNQATMEVAENTILYVDDFMEMADKIISVIKDPNGHKSLTEKALKQVKRFTWDKTAEGISAIYH